MDTQKIVHQILESGITQVELAKEIGCSQSYISDLLHGRRKGRIGFEIGVALVKVHEKVASQINQAA